MLSAKGFPQFMAGNDVVFLIAQPIQCNLQVDEFPDMVFQRLLNMKRPGAFGSYLIVSMKNKSSKRNAHPLRCAAVRHAHARHSQETDNQSSVFFALEYRTGIPIINQETSFSTAS